MIVDLSVFYTWFSKLSNSSKMYLLLSKCNPKEVTSVSVKDWGSTVTMMDGSVINIGRDA